MRRVLPLLALFVAACDCAGCGDEDDIDSIAAEGEDGEPDLEGEPVDPPFTVAGDAEGLLLVWFDEEGPHSVESREAIPEEHRERVRVDSLRLAPDERLDPSMVYVADLRAEVDGRYPVRTLSREAFDLLVDRAAGTEGVSEAVAAAGGDGAATPTAGTDPNADVIIYGADWCGACRSAARFFQSRNIPFVEKNIERDRAALAEMQAKARQAGVRPSGIPVIDFRGTILPGFDQARLEQLIASSGGSGTGATI